jgi:RimJ/RimL family protein N-acetyltransferase
MDSIVESIERATFAAVPPQQVLELPGWLAGLDDGTVGRAHSAVPLRHQPPVPELPLRALEAAYAARGLIPVVRLPNAQAFESSARALASAGYAPNQPTVTQTATLPLRVRSSSHDVRLASQPDEHWERLFLGVTTNAADAVSRLAILRRAQGTWFAGIHVEDRLRAVGVCRLGHGWCGIHGTRTEEAWRGRGLAAAILDAFARHAQAHGVHRAFLQVEQANRDARSLYRRAGFDTAWDYSYWRRTRA